jgi:hypothetical protein
MKLNKKESNNFLSEMQKTEQRKPNKVEKQIVSYIKSDEVEIVPIKSDVIFPQNKVEPVETVKTTENITITNKPKRKYTKKTLGKGKYPKKPLYHKDTKIKYIPTKKIPITIKIKSNGKTIYLKGKKIVAKGKPYEKVSKSQKMRVGTKKGKHGKRK